MSWDQNVTMHQAILTVILITKSLSRTRHS